VKFNSHSPLSEPDLDLLLGFCLLNSCRGDSQGRFVTVNSRSPPYDFDPRCFITLAKGQVAS